MSRRMKHRFALAAAALAILGSCVKPIDDSVLDYAKDAIAPVIVLSSPADGKPYSATVPVAGSVSDDAQKKGDGRGLCVELRYAVLGTAISGSLVPDAAGSFAFSFETGSLTGSITLSLEAEDRNGNVGAKSLVLVNAGNGIPSFAATVSSGAVDLSWEASPLTTGYDLYYTTNGSLPSAGYGQKVEGISAAATSYTLAGLQNGALHVFQLRSRSSSGSDNWSDYLSCVPLSEQTLVPEVKTESGGLRVLWNGIAATSSFEVHRSSSKAGSYENISGAVSGTSFLDSFVTAEQVYYYKVRPAIEGASLSAAGAGVAGGIPESYPFYGVGALPSASLPGNPIAVAVDEANKRAFAITYGNPGYLVCIDISDPSDPALLGSLALGTSTVFGADIALSGNYAYVAAGWNGSSNPVMVIANVSTPSAPAEVGRAVYASITSPATAIAVSGGYACLGASANLLIYEVTTPSSPAYRGISASLGATVEAVKIVGGYAYVAANNQGLKVVNVSAPGAPSISYSETSPSGHALGLAINGSTLYLASAASGLRIYSIATPASPSYTGAYDTGGTARDVVLSGGYAVVADDSLGLQIVDVANPSSPSLAGWYDTPGVAVGIARYGGLVVVADTAGGLRVAAAPAIPSLVDSLSWGGKVNDVTVLGNVAYAAIESVGLCAVDASDPVNLSAPSPWSVPGLNLEVAARGNIATLAPYSSLRLFNISTPGTIALYRTIGGDPSATVISGDYAYFANLTGMTLQAVDITRPSDAAQTVVRGTLYIPQTSRGMATEGSLLAMALESTGAQFIDISTPSTPVLAGYWSKASFIAQGIALSGSRAYVIGQTGALWAIDVSDPASPADLGSCEVGGAGDTDRDLVVSGNLVFVAAGSAGLRIVDARNPAKMRIVSSVATAAAQGVALRGRYVFVADGSGGLKCFDLLMGY